MNFYNKTFGLQGGSASGWGSGNESLRNYCTEDTPANISQATSISDLSALSIPGEDSTRKFSQTPSRGLKTPQPISQLLNDSADNSSDNDNILEQCIQSAMPKVSKIFNNRKFAKQNGKNLNF